MAVVAQPACCCRCRSTVATADPRLSVIFSYIRLYTTDYDESNWAAATDGKRWMGRVGLAHGRQRPGSGRLAAVCANNVCLPALAFRRCCRQRRGASRLAKRANGDVQRHAGLPVLLWHRHARRPGLGRRLRLALADVAMRQPPPRRDLAARGGALIVCCDSGVFLDTQSCCSVWILSWDLAQTVESPRLAFLFVSWVAAAGCRAAWPRLGGRGAARFGLGPVYWLPCLCFSCR